MRKNNLSVLLPGVHQRAALTHAIREGLQRFEEWRSKEVQVCRNKDHFSAKRRSLVHDQILNMIDLRPDLHMSYETIPNGPCTVVVIHFEDRNLKAAIMNMPSDKKLPTFSDFRREFSMNNSQIMADRGIKEHGYQQMMMDLPVDDAEDAEAFCEYTSNDDKFGLIVAYDGRMGVHTIFRIGAVPPEVDRWLFEIKINAAVYSHLDKVVLDEDFDEDIEITFKDFDEEDDTGM